MTTPENKPAAKPAAKKPSVAGRQSMTPEAAKKMGLDPKPYGKATAKK